MYRLAMTYPTTTVPPPDEQPNEHPVQRGVLWLARALTYFVYAYLIIVEIILAIGFFLKLFGANPSSGFVEWSYRNLDRAMQPFRGIFAPIELGTTGNNVEATLETSIIFAMMIYGIVAIGVSALISWLTTRIHRLDRDSIRERARQQHERELQALRDQATILEAQRDAQIAGRYPAGMAPTDVAPPSNAPTYPEPTPDPAPLEPGGGQAPPAR